MRAALLAVLLAGTGCRGGAPELDGSWFVRYASDPTPYLDVAFRGRRPDRVEAVLSGPEGRREDLALRWNAEDVEWQASPTLPWPLPGGMWWVSEVRAQVGRRALVWAAARPEDAYTLSSGGEPRPVPARPGFFYAAEPGPVRVRVETAGPKDGPRADPIVTVFADGALGTWLAAVDDSDVHDPYPTFVMPVTPGATYLVRVTGAEDDAGPYSLRVVPEAAPPLASPPRGGPTPDAHEPDDTPDRAVPLPLGAVLQRSLGGTRGPDVDWFRFVAPP